MLKLKTNVKVNLQIGYTFMYKDCVFTVHDIESFLKRKSFVIHVTDLNTNELHVMRQNGNSNRFWVHDLYTYFKKYHIDYNF